MAGESPGREQRHETSGEAADPVAADPRLVVFREGSGTREAPVASLAVGAREQHEGAGGQRSDASSRRDGAAGTAPDARPHPAAESAPEADPDTPDAVDAVDTLTDPATPSSPPAPRGPSSEDGKTEPNRDPAEAAAKAPERADAGSAGSGQAVTTPEADEDRAAAAADADAAADKGADTGTSGDGDGEEAGSVGQDAGSAGRAGGARAGAADAAGAGADTSAGADGAEGPEDGGPAEGAGGGEGAKAARGTGGDGAAERGRDGRDPGRVRGAGAVGAGRGAGSAGAAGAAGGHGVARPAEADGHAGGHQPGEHPATPDDGPADRTLALSAGNGGTSHDWFTRDRGGRRPAAAGPAEPSRGAPAGAAAPADRAAGATADGIGTAADRPGSRDSAATRPSAGAAARTAGAAGTAASRADRAAGTAGAADAASAGRADGAEAAGAPVTDKPGNGNGTAGRRVVRPLVSDLPEERVPQVTYGTPGTPTRATPTGRGALPKAPASPYEAAAAAPQPLPDTVGAQNAGPEGTRRMPVPALPDKPPLKLLAELTNTPPPPQTALRSVVRRFKIWTPLVVLLALVFVIVQAVRPLPTPTLASTTAASYTFTGTPLTQTMPWPTEGQTAIEIEGLGTLGVRGAQTPVPIASITKVMTAYVILRDHPLSGQQNGPVIAVDQAAADGAKSVDESTAPVTMGQKFTERQMLELMLVPSGNNIARLLARWDAGSEKAFVVKMQQAAERLGMTHTTYTGASGFDSTTVSTATDLLKLERVVMKNDVFRWVVSQPNVTLPGIGRIFNNNNDLVHPGVIGVKTGSSTPAGGALMWAAQKKIGGKEQLILGVVLQQHGGSTPNDSLDVALHRSLALMQSVQRGLATATIVKKGEVVGQIDDGFGGRTAVVAASDLVAVGWPGMRTTLTLDPAPSGLPHSAKAGTPVGTLSFGSGAARTSVPAVLQTDLEEPGFAKKLTRLG